MIGEPAKPRGATAKSAGTDDNDGLWVFAYGSLMWRPDLPFESVRPATLSRFHRCFCVSSIHHRGTEQNPGLVLGLDAGGVCHGLAYRVCKGEEAATLSALREREQVSGVYREAIVPISFADGLRPTITAITYLAERAHPSYAGHLTLAQQARRIRRAKGLSGRNVDYFFNTLCELDRLGLRERSLERLAVLVGPMFGDGDGAEIGRRTRANGLGRALAATAIGEWRELRVGDRRRFQHRRFLGT